MDAWVRGSLSKCLQTPMFHGAFELVRCHGIGFTVTLSFDGEWFGEGLIVAVTAYVLVYTSNT